MLEFGRLNGPMDGFYNESAYFKSLPLSIQNRLITSGAIFSNDEEMQMYVSTMLGIRE